jgi:hypothetical protein
VAGSSGVASFAHLGGYVAGMVPVMLFAQRPAGDVGGEYSKESRVAGLPGSFNAILHWVNRNQRSG